MIVRFVLAFLLFFAVPSFAQKKKVTSRVPTHGLLWEISGNGLKEKSYLFGTYHLLTKDYIDTLPKLLSRLTRAKQVVGEMVIDSMDAGFAMSALISAMSPKPLNELLTPEDYQLVAKEFKNATGMSIEMMRLFKPMATYLLLYMQKAEKTSGNALTKSDDMLEMYIQRDARSMGKPVVGLETIGDQVHALLDQFPLERQAEMLVELVKDSTNDEGDLKNVTDCYFAEDLACLKELMSKEVVDPMEMRGLLEDRNVKWMKLLPKIMKDCSSFIAVGALHLAGKEGLVSELRRKGYRVERVSLK
jgi:uncharacterized protein